MAAHLLKHIRVPNAVNLLKNVLESLQEIERKGDLDYIYTSLTYIIEAGEIKDENEYIETIRSGFTQIDEGIVMTLAEQYRQRGRQEGRQEGIDIAEREIAIKLLGMDMTIEKIAQVTSLSSNEIEELKKKMH